MENAYNLFINKLFMKADLGKIPLAGTFELTSRCTLDCKMCYIHKGICNKEAQSREKSTEWWLNLAEDCKKRGTLNLLLTGGEPLVRSDFKEIYLKLREMGFLLNINTNATLIDDEYIEFFRVYPPQRLNITLYGCSERTYEELCGDGSAYEKVKHAIEGLKKNGVNIRFNYTVTPLNKDDLSKARAYARALGIEMKTVTYIFEPVRASGDAFRLSPEEAAKLDFENKLQSLTEERLAEIVKSGKKGEQGRRREFLTDECEGISCRAGLSSFWVTYDGKMTPCGMMTHPSVEIEDFNTAWACMNQAHEEIKMPRECRDCEYRKNCDICAAVSLAETGDFSKVPEYACKKAKAYCRQVQNLVEKSQESRN